MVDIRKTKHQTRRPEGFLPMRDVARILGCTVMAVSGWIRKEIVPVDQVQRVLNVAGQERIFVSREWIQRELDRQVAELQLRVQLLKSM